MQALTTTNRLVVFIIAMVYLMLPHTVSSQGSSSPDPNLQIVFASDRGGTEGPIYMMNPDGTNIRLLPINDGRNISPACSPEGGYIAFYSEIGLQVADVDFTDVQTVVPRASSLSGFSLSANAGKVAFVRVEDGNRNIHVSNIDGTGLIRLTTQPTFDVWPALSPDGTKVVFASNRSGQPNNYELYVINTDGSNLTQLTNTGGSNTDPRWSPDGTRIAFTSDRAGSGHLDIYVMNADGSNPISLTNSAGNYQPAWSPDGTQIVFVSDRDSEYQHQIYVMNADGTNVTRVTNDAYFNDQPCWLIILPSTACSTTIPVSDTAALIAAITSANGAGTPQTLCLTSSTYTLDTAPTITSDITIVGDGATIIFADGGGFEVAGDGRLRLEQVSVIRSDDGGG